MADQTLKPPISRSSTALTPAGVDNPTTARSRNRRAPNSNNAPNTATSPTGGPSRQSPSPSRGLQSGGLSSPLNGAFSRGLLEGSWTPNWSSVQDFATSLLDGGYSSEPSRPNSRNGPKSQPKSFWKGFGALTRKTSETWGPAPLSNDRPAPDDIAAGSRARREAELMARKKASVLESHEGRRNSDENMRSVSQPVIEEFLVYLHHVQPTDTYAGIILRYRCMEHALRKINGLWSRDNIQIRKHLLIPVDACETKGRPCDPPSLQSQKVDHLAMTPQPSSRLHDDYFGSLNGKTNEHAIQEADERPWTHEPVEIVRVKRTNVGYFPPRRKKSIHTASTYSTPRQSLELSKAVSNTSVIAGSPGGNSSRRQSTISTRPAASSLSFGSPASGRSRGNSLGQMEGVPAWMRKPGGVGSMGKSVKAPGPANDSFNTWVNKRLPGFNIDSLPSMSVMGSETAHFGFSAKTEESTGIVESPFEEGRDATAPSRNGVGLENAAASIETWLRGAWAKRPGTPKLGSLRKPPDDLDLIELADTTSDDGRPGNPIGSSSSHGNIYDQNIHGSTSRSAGEGTASMRGRPMLMGVIGRRKTMPICIECRHPVRTLWTQYSGAGDASSNIRLTVYRHLLHNTLMRDRDRFDPSIIRLGTLLLLFDVYLTWARIEKQVVPDSSSSSTPSSDAATTGEGGSNLGALAQQPIVFQYIFFLILCTFSTLAFHLSIRFLTSSPLSPLSLLSFLPSYPRPNSVSTALLVSSSTKLFPILMVIWDYDVPAAARSLGWAVVANNVEALAILLDCGYGVAVFLAAAGAVTRWLVGRGILWCVGLHGVDSVAESDVAVDGRALWALLGRVREWGGMLAVG
ncbi:carbohydrate-binding module family 50 protein [Xylaria bambusicola]|uniref:carbohydrate-binding module family 50 protein n=1 Tax=Xylaria bambusicola TaxID=326684 RepID=UPI00200891C3|nr:carbohydrate-binding module family 50 protein [Xylaria bambusicola]KAI0506223.1 carbohydrate-binding module family 50 protein [Xylaria bambusicola]